MVRTAVGRFRIIAFLEGLSFVLLVFVAMPLKYGMGLPQAVRLVGMAHGVLFVAFIVTLAGAALAASWTLRQVAVAFAASLLPFGTLLMDRTWRSMDPAVKE